MATPSFKPNLPPLLPDAELAGLLNSILHATEAEERRGAEAAVVLALGNRANLPGLVRLLCGEGEGEGPSAGVRQLAAVLLRKRIFSFWAVLDASERTALKAVVLRRLGEEPVRAVRLALAHVVGRLAKADGRWGELAGAIHAAATGDARADMRELAMVLVHSLAEVFAGAPGLGEVAAGAVLRGLADAEAGVQRAAVKAAVALLPSLEDDAAAHGGLLRELLPLTVGLLQANARDPTRASLCRGLFELLEVVTEALSPKKNAGQLVELARGLLAVMEDRSTTASVRDGCGIALEELAARRPKFVVSHNLLQPLVDACVRMMAEDATIALPENNLDDPDEDDKDPNNDMDDDEDEDDMEAARSPCMIGGYLLSGLADKIPSKPFTAALLPFISAISDSSNNTNNSQPTHPFERKACALAMAALAEGSPAFLRRRVGTVLDLACRFLADEDATPREAAAFALRYFAEHLQPEILTHHSLLIPLLRDLLAKESGDLVRRRLAEALDTLCENLEEELEPYVVELMPVIVGALHHNTNDPHNSGGVSLETQTALCGVISSIAATKCPAFLPFAGPLLELFQQPLAQTAPATLALRAQATETAGIVGAAMGKAAFAPYVELFMPRIRENLSLGSAVLREHSFGFLSNLCEILQGDFMPYLDDALAAALHAIEEDTAIYTNRHPLAKGDMPLVLEDDFENRGGLNSHGHPADDEVKSGEEEAEDEEEEADAAEEIHMRVRTADIEEKSSALYCIGVFAEVLRGEFGESRVGRCWDGLSPLEGHFHPNVRGNAMVAGAKLLRASHGGAEVVPSQTEDTLSPRTRGLLNDFVHHVLLRTMQEEPEKEVFIAACEAMEGVVKFFGPQCFPFGPDALVRECVEGLRQRKACLLADEDASSTSSEDPDDDGDELFRAVDDAPAGTSSWREVISPQDVLRGVYLPEDHNEALDAIVEVLEALAGAYGGAFLPYAAYLFPLLGLYGDPQRRPAEDLVMATGSFAGLLLALGAGAAGAHFEAARALAFGVLRGSDDSAARGNSCYLLRVLVESCPERFLEPLGESSASFSSFSSSSSSLSMVEETLRALWEVVSGGAVAEIPQAVDNAVSAACSLVRCLPPGVVPREEILPSLLPLIPMRLEKAENANALATLVFLLSAEAEGTARAAWLPGMVGCIARVVAARGVDEAEKATLLQAGVRSFIARQPQAWQQACAVAELDGDQQEALRSSGVLCM
ncbi:unnamed protein product [Phytomonas sp. Hart1]|nr:unnamed protein product [Phytomonas sp. Hart1]|eukprot:CCW71654.1 unnamed protein product [Phytomonas sp. isolate Hart1]